MRRVVLDASYAASWFLPDEESGQSECLLEEVQKGHVELCVPELWIYEIANLLRMAGRRGRLRESGLIEAREFLAEIPVNRYGHSPMMLARWLALADKYDLSAYDAAYLELAERLNLPLKTLDKKLKEVAQKEKLPD